LEVPIEGIEDGIPITYVPFINILRLRGFKKAGVSDFIEYCS
jgi:hypothetical protein